MPMQPSPMADTSRLLFPSLRFCICFSIKHSPRQDWWLLRRELRLGITGMHESTTIYASASPELVVKLGSPKANSPYLIKFHIRRRLQQLLRGVPRVLFPQPASSA